MSLNRVVPFPCHHSNLATSLKKTKQANGIQGAVVNEAFPYWQINIPPVTGRAFKLNVGGQVTAAFHSRGNVS